MDLQIAVAASLLPASRARGRQPCSRPIDASRAIRRSRSLCLGRLRAAGRALPMPPWRRPTRCCRAAPRQDIVADAVVRPGLPGAARLHSRPAAGPLDRAATRPCSPADGRDRRIRAPPPTTPGRSRGGSVPSSADAGIVVASGLARGVGLRGAQRRARCGGVTVAVLGCGPDRVYPAEHAALARTIARTRGRGQRARARRGRRYPSTFRCGTASSAASRWPWSWSRRPRRADP